MLILFGAGAVCKKPAKLLILSELSTDACLLDLCCGAGHLTRALAGRGYRVTGLDGSAEMLRYARENAPSAEFIWTDARTFSSPQMQGST
jgi:trans-aconitate methyltransferase